MKAKVDKAELLKMQFDYIGVKNKHTLEECLELLNIAGLARVTQVCWPNMYFGAVPYVRELRGCNKLSDTHIVGDYTSVALRFLINANTWRGPVARAVKAELNKRLKEKN